MPGNIALRQPEAVFHRVSIRRADHYAWELLASYSATAADAAIALQAKQDDLVFQSAGRITMPGNSGHSPMRGASAEFQSAGRITMPGNLIGTGSLLSWLCVSIRRADHYAWEQQGSEARH